MNCARYGVTAICLGHVLEECQTSIKQVAANLGYVWIEVKESFNFANLGYVWIEVKESFNFANLGYVWIEVKESFNFANLGMFGLKSRKLEKVTETQSFYLMTIISSVIS
jgi:hypothetical protein